MEEISGLVALYNALWIASLECGKLSQVLFIKLSESYNTRHVANNPIEKQYYIPIR